MAVHPAGSIHLTITRTEGNLEHWNMQGSQAITQRPHLDTRHFEGQHTFGCSKPETRVAACCHTLVIRVPPVTLSHITDPRLTRSHLAHQLLTLTSPGHSLLSQVTL